MEETRVDVSVFQKSKKGNKCCGDSFYFTETNNQFVCILADGLGSGEYAKESSQAVIELVKNNHDITMEELVEKSNEILHGKRGVVLGILKIDFIKESYSISTIGNISIMTVTDDREKQRNIPISGYLAGFKGPVKVKEYKLKKGMNFFMFSDGVQDNELLRCFFIEKDVHVITKMYGLASEHERHDDTTLIAMRYEG